MKKRYVFALLIVIIGILLFFTPFSLAHVCGLKDDGSFMRCHWMGEAVRMLGGLIVVLGVVFALCAKMAKGIALSVACVGFCEILLQFFVIGTCKMPKMSCNVYTKPTVILLSFTLMVVSLVYIFMTRKEN